MKNITRYEHELGHGQLEASKVSRIFFSKVKYFVK
jgi:hypothetical protein